jgi:hypothetical protein
MAAHAVLEPNALILMSCPPGKRCDHCATLSADVLEASDHLHSKFGGRGLVMKRSGEHFLLYDELNQLGEVPKLPQEFVDANFQECRLCRKFCFQHLANLKQHGQLRHGGKVKLTEMCATPFACNLYLPRKQGPDGTPYGEYTRCNFKSSNEKDFKTHKLDVHPGQEEEDELDAADETDEAGADDHSSAEVILSNDILHSF